MSNIRILPEILSNKIAAGEVVERPASVVKELLENAVDAGATRIIVDVEKGGRSLIRISDNGHGMSQDDALLSIERYATSKIYSQDDLFAIKTLGFRGEALPSIASVSRFTLVTRDRGSDAGTEIVIDGGKIKTVSEIGAPVGTMIAVKQLFFNTPARRKFLKSIPTEMGQIAECRSMLA
jgi:DNA mismatch repair protein MutL